MGLDRVGMRGGIYCRCCAPLIACTQRSSVLDSGRRAFIVLFLWRHPDNGSAVGCPLGRKANRERDIERCSW